MNRTVIKEAIKKITSRDTLNKIALNNSTVRDITTNILSESTNLFNPEIDTEIFDDDNTEEL